MLIYIARRLVWTIIVVLVVIFVTFLVFFKLPNGDPALRFAGRSPTTDELAEIRHRLHLDQPFYKEFGLFTWTFVKGDDGSFHEHFGETRDDPLREYHEVNDLPVVGLWEAGLLRCEAGRVELSGAAARVFRKGQPPVDVPPGACPL